MPLLALVRLHNSQHAGVVLRGNEQGHVVLFRVDENVICKSAGHDIANRYAGFLGDLALEIGDHLIALGEQGTPAAGPSDVVTVTSVTVVLVAVAAKLLAYVLALESGFRGGAIFPAVFIGVALGTATAVIIDEGGAIIPMYADLLLGISEKLGHGKVAGNWELDGNRMAERWWFKS